MKKPTWRGTAQFVSNLVGAKDLVDYAGSKIAKLTAPKAHRKYISDTTSGRKAAQSAANVAMAVGTGGAGILKVAGKRAVTATAGKKIAKTAVRTARKVAPKAPRSPKLKITDTTKRGYKGKGHEIPLRKTWDEGGW